MESEGDCDWLLLTPEKAKENKGGETRCARTASGDKRCSIHTKKSDFAESPFGTRQYHRRRKVALVLAPFGLCDHSAESGEHLAAARKTPRLHEICRRLVPELLVRHGTYY